MGVIRGGGKARLTSVIKINRKRGFIIQLCDVFWFGYNNKNVGYIIVDRSKSYLISHYPQKMSISIVVMYDNLDRFISIFFHRSLLINDFLLVVRGYMTS